MLVQAEPGRLVSLAGQMMKVGSSVGCSDIARLGLPKPRNLQQQCSTVQITAKKPAPLQQRLHSAAVAGLLASAG
jgi:hypothetical protein